jgi:CRP/FNR family transcriptional regulator, anaerobic regulatory protein
MTSAAFPLHRRELRLLLEHGDALLLDAMGPPQVFRPGDKLVREGEPSDNIFRIHSGWVVRARDLLQCKRQIIAIFLPGDLAGVKSMLLERQPDSVECLTDVAAQSIDYAALAELAQANYAVALRIMFQLGEDERRLHNLVSALGKADAEQRLADMLLDLRGRLHRLGFVKNDTFRFPLTQQQIGDYAGLTVVHVNRVLRRFRESEIAVVSKGTATILDSEALGRRAAFVQDVFERETPEFSGAALL